jgi:hypothetical protein
MRVAELAGPALAQRKDGAQPCACASHCRAPRSGINMAGCLVILMLAPAVTVVGYEVGYRHQAEALAE